MLDSLWRFERVCALLTAIPPELVSASLSALSTRSMPAQERPEPHRSAERRVNQPSQASHTSSITDGPRVEHVEGTGGLAVGVAPAGAFRTDLCRRRGA